MITFYGQRSVGSGPRVFRFHPSDTPSRSSDSSQQPPNTDTRYRQSKAASVRSPIKDVSPTENRQSFSIGYLRYLRSSADSETIATALSKIKPVLEGKQKEFCMRGVTNELYDLLDAASRDDLAGWEGAR